MPELADQDSRDPESQQRVIELHRVYRELYGVWLPQSGEEAADRPPIELYVNSPRDVPPSEWLTEVFLPLK